ncbi:MAG: formyltransferase family protein [Thermomicrobiales bacterium]
MADQGEGQQDVKQDRPWRAAVLLSGAGRTLENLLRVIAWGELPVEVVVVVSSVPDVRGLEVAAQAGIPAATITRKGHPSVHAYSQAIYDAVVPFSPDLILMAGFLRQVLVFPGWEGRILNIHPALLPDAAAYAAGKGMFGERVHAAVLAHGDTVSGATVHVVTDEYDDGPPLMRVEVPVLPDDTPVTLGTRVFHAECGLYPEAIRRYLAANPGLRNELPAGMGRPG